MRSALLALLLVPAVAAGCGGGTPARRDTAGGAPGLEGPAGRLVSIGGGRSLFVHCAGSGGPTVLLEAGFGAGAASWGAVQPRLARTTRTCAYDRAGSGSSVAPPGVRDARDELTDLRRLLARAALPPPYVLVGHSYGGVLARVFADRYRAETAGLVLVDTMGRDGRRRQLGRWPRSVAPRRRAGLAAAVIGSVDLGAGEAIASRVRSLGDLPLVVVTAGREAALPQRPVRLARGLRRLWNSMQDELAGLSADSLHVVAVRSTHDVPSPEAGQPAVVVRAVEAVVRAARDHARLPPCPRVFTGPAVRCRG